MYNNYTFRNVNAGRSISKQPRTFPFILQQMVLFTHLTCAADAVMLQYVAFYTHTSPAVFINVCDHLNREGIHICGKICTTAMPIIYTNLATIGKWRVLCIGRF